MLDCRNFSALMTAASRIRALAMAASCILSGSLPADRLERESIALYLIDLAADIAREIEEGADRADYEAREEVA